MKTLFDMATSVLLSVGKMAILLVVPVASVINTIINVFINAVELLNALSSMLIRLHKSMLSAHTIFNNVALRYGVINRAYQILSEK